MHSRFTTTAAGKIKIGHRFYLWEICHRGEMALLFPCFVSKKEIRMKLKIVPKVASPHVFQCSHRNFVFKIGFGGIIVTSTKKMERDIM